MKTFALLSVLIVSGTAIPATACRLPTAVSAIIHSELPDVLPSDVVAAEVEFSASLDVATFRRSGAEARIVRPIQGSFPGSVIWVRALAGWSSCHHAFANGRRGLIVGRFVMGEAGIHLEPIWVARRNDFRMRPAINMR